MSIGSKIKFFRKLRGLTQLELGEKIGIEENPRVRISQYEADIRTPKADMMLSIAKTLKIAPEALDVMDVSDLNKIAQFFFELEREYGLTVKQTGEKVILYLDGSKTGTKVFNRMLTEWAEKHDALKGCTIQEKDYNEWQYKYTI